MQPGDHVRHRIDGRRGVVESLPRGANDVVWVRWGITDQDVFRSQLGAIHLEVIRVKLADGLGGQALANLGLEEKRRRDTQG